MRSRCFAFRGGLFSSSAPGSLSKSFLLHPEGFVTKGKEETGCVTRGVYESLAEARRNTERNARAASLGLPSLAATKRHYPRLDTLATLSLLPPFALPPPRPLSPFLPLPRALLRSALLLPLSRQRALPLGLSLALSLALPPAVFLSLRRDLASFSDSRDLCT